jgi:hypothetical protein
VRANSLLEPAETEALRVALERFRLDAVQAILGDVGRSALDRGDLAGAARAIRGSDSPTATLVSMFLLGRRVRRTEAAAALAPLPLATAEAAGLISLDQGDVVATLDLRPYGEQSDGQTWWVVSDLGSEVRPGPLPPDHVLGIGSAALTLAQATVRSPVARALDLGTGCGVQALHLSRHADHVVATDISRRALRMAATTAALNGLDWDLREGSLLEPVADERFDLIVANPPFVVSPGWTGDTGGFDYRDSGLAGDAVSRRLVASLPSALAEGGTAQLLANWAITGEQPWTERVGGWLAGQPVDAWIWQRELAEPGEYVSLWLRDAGLVAGTPLWVRRYDEWLDWFDTHGVLAVGMGLVSLRRTDRAQTTVVLEDVRQPVAQPAGAGIAAWFDRAQWLGDAGATGLLNAALRAGDGLVLSAHSVRSELEGWTVAQRQLRQADGARWELEVDSAIAALVAGCGGQTPVLALISVLAASLDRPVDEVVAAVLPVLSDLVQRGILVPPSGLAPGQEPA